MPRYSLSVILLIYFLLSLFILITWHEKGINTVTGDEPHYLVMASGISKYMSLEQTTPYIEEFKSRAIYKPGLAPEGVKPCSQNTHAVLGPRGLFNVHNIGLPFLLAIPFWFGGVIGSKIFMIFLNSIVILLAWKFSFYFSKNKAQRFWSVIATTISMPFLPASNQIYPDMVAGLLTLTGLYWFYTLSQQRTRVHEFLLTVLLAFLPWLQIKFAATSILLILAITGKIYLDSKDISRVLRILLIVCASFIVLALYNDYAFGRLYGPYRSDALELSKTSFMVLLGLFFDQNQGFLILNPLNLVGVFAIGRIFKCNRLFTFVWGLAFLSLIIPNALHPNWYGGGSFSGRFEWAANMVFVIPTIFGLLELGKRRKEIFRIFTFLGILLQILLFYQYTIRGVNLYNKNFETWFDSYSIFYFPAHVWMPMLYNSAWAYEYWPNYVWFFLVSALFILGFLSKERILQKIVIIFLIFLTLSFFSSFLNKPNLNKIKFFANELPSQIGRTKNSSRVADENIDIGADFWTKKIRAYISLPPMIG